jgi:hypothetical protein
LEAFYPFSIECFIGKSYLICFSALYSALGASGFNPAFKQPKAFRELGVKPPKKLLRSKISGDPHLKNLFPAFIAQGNRIIEGYFWKRMKAL